MVIVQIFDAREDDKFSGYIGKIGYQKNPNTLSIDLYGQRIVEPLRFRFIFSAVHYNNS